MARFAVRTAVAERVTYLEKARLYKCNEKHPKQKFSLKVGTVFEDSPIALEKWLPAVWMLCNDKNGVSSYETSPRSRCHSEVCMVHASPHSACDANADRL